MQISCAAIISPDGAFLQQICAENSQLSGMVVRSTQEADAFQRWWRTSREHFDDLLLGQTNRLFKRRMPLTTTWLFPSRFSR
jgi:hypothetical protein